MSRIMLCSCILLLTCGLASAETGLQGRVAWRGKVCSGVRVHAYHTIADIATEKSVAVSPPTGADGIYHLDLAAGSYYLTARNFDGKAEPGKLFCYYNGGAVTVRNGFRTTVSFNLIRIPQESPPQPSSNSGIRGEITFEDRPLERSYLYVYQDANEGFKGPGYFIQPVATGKFRLNLPPGSYYLLARKRVKGGQFGPIEAGDYFNYYFGNPITIEAGKTREIKLETITRLALNETGEDLPFRGVRGLITGPGGKKIKGVHVFAYRNPAMTGTPDFFSPPSDASGRFELPLTASGSFYLLAREGFGGPAEEGELYGKYRGNRGGVVTLSDESTLQEIEIHVEKHHPL